MQLEAVSQCFKDTAKAAIANTGMDILHNIFPIVLGASDKTYEGGNVWLELPWDMLYAMKYWFARRQAGTWRFCPCEFGVCRGSWLLRARSRVESC